jgi:hypothetical protein
MTNVHTFCTESANGDPEAAGALTARFFGRLLRSLKVESRAPSPAPPNSTQTSTVQSEPQTDFLFDLVGGHRRQSLVADESRHLQDTFLSNCNTDLDQTLTLDHEYWGHLFYSNDSQNGFSSGNLHSGTLP